MKNNPKVAVAINCFNHERFIAECVQSVINQTYTNWRIFFYDSNSTDRSREIAYDYQKDYGVEKFRLDKPIGDKILPIGLSRYYNVMSALQDKDVEYVAIMDADDYWDKEKLERQLIAFDLKPNSSICFTDANYLHWKKGWCQIDNYPAFYENDLYTKVVTGTFHDKYPVIRSNDPFIDILTRYNFMPCLTLMFKANDLRTVIGQPTHYTSAEDYDWILKVLAKYNNFAYSDYALAYYRIHSDQITSKTPARCTAEEIDVVKRAMYFRDLTKKEKRKVYRHIFYLYCKLIYKEIVEWRRSR